MNKKTCIQAVTVVVTRQALRHNIQTIKSKVGQSRIMAVVKANAYGHGLLETARTLEEYADYFGVARLGEALRLRAGGIIKPIVLLEGFVSIDDLPVLAENNLQTVIHCVEQLDAIERSNLHKTINVWMKIDTGMHRLGINPQQVETIYQRLIKCKNVTQPINIVSHFSRTDELGCGFTELQIEKFKQSINEKNGLKSIAASGGILFWPEAYYDVVRPGIIMYGVSPQESSFGQDFNLQPAMTLKSCLIAVRPHDAGDPVGYGGEWVSQRNTILGVIAIGYGDGYPRSAPSGTPVLVNGREVPLVGRVSMDMITVDLGPNAQEKIGDEVILWGDSLPVEKVAKVMNFSAYELITKLTARVSISYID